MKTFTAIVVLCLLGIPAFSQPVQANSKSAGTLRQRSRVSIRVLDKFSLRPVRATIMLVGNHPGRQVAPRFENGIYQFRMSAGDTSVISIHAAGYEMLSEAVAGRDLHATKIFYLTPIENSTERAREPVIEQNIPVLEDDIRATLHFPQSEADILPESGYELEILAGYLVRNAGSRIELMGHTDDVGDPFKNLLLSFDRVDEVRKYLVSKHIETNRIRGKGFGSDLPVAPNDCEANRRLNRRVEIRIVP
ncbi:MAG: OmpA family protein [Dyadobacter fermentans]